MNRPACPFLRSAPTENSREARPETGKNHYLASAPPYPGPQETYLYMDPYTLFENMLAADTARLAAADSTLTAHLQAAAETHQTKFWLVENFWNWLGSHGVGPGWSDGITFLCLCLALAFTVWAVDRIISRFVIGFIKQRVLNSKTDIDDILFRRKFFGRLLYLVPLGIVLFGITIFFRGFDPSLILAARLITRSAIIFTLLLVCFSLLDTLNDLYQRRPEAQRRSIKGYIQICKIFLTFLAVILIIATLLQKNPTTLLVGLGAAAAVLSLVFKDTLLGLVASIQLSAQDMVRPGDWIEMPSKGADGTVLDINLNSVKVRNWDNTITMIPIYSMVTEAFINWRGMETSDGRRFVRHFYIDMGSVRFADQELLQQIAAHPATAPLAEASLELARASSPDNLTNLALFRAHIETYLFRHPRLNHDLLTYARYMPDITERGIGLEVYAFSKEKSPYDFDSVHRSVVEYVIASAPVFGIRMFQNPSGADIADALQGLTHHA